MKLSIFTVAEQLQCLHTFRELHGMAPAYKSELCQSVCVNEGRATLRSASNKEVLAPTDQHVPVKQTLNSVIELSVSLHGTVCRLSFDSLRCRRHSKFPKIDSELSELLYLSLNDNVKRPRAQGGFFAQHHYRRSTIISFTIELELVGVEEDAMIMDIINLFTGLQ